MAAKDFSYTNLVGEDCLHQQIFKGGELGIIWKKNTYQSQGEDCVKHHLYSSICTWGL